MSTFQPEKIHRVIIKLSGEYLAGEKGFGFDHSIIDSLTNEIIEIRRMGLSIGIVLGGGNLFRGAFAENINRVVADNIGMLATMQNALYVSDVLRQKNYNAEIFSAVQANNFAKLYTHNRAEKSLQEGSICFFCAGTGNPFFTTDTAAVLRAIELNAEIVLKGTKVDGVYTADPKKDPSATFIDRISYDDALQMQLNVMDMTAFSLARENKIPIKVFNITKKDNLKAALTSSEVGTYVHP